MPVAFSFILGFALGAVRYRSHSEYPFEPCRKDGGSAWDEAEEQLRDFRADVAVKNYPLAAELLKRLEGEGDNLNPSR